MISHDDSMEPTDPTPIDPLEAAKRAIDARRGQKRNDAVAPFPTQAYSDLPDEDWEWLWDGRIPLGAVSFIEGYAGDGKSTVTADIAARVSRGVGMPDDPAPRSPSAVLWFTTEESPTKTIRKRLRIAGADMRNIHNIDLPAIAREKNAPRFTFPSGRARLSSTITATSARLDLPVRLVIIDGSLSVFDQKLEFTNSQHVRDVLGAIHLVAVEHNCAIVMILHPNKSKGGLAQHRASGAAGWGDFVRTSLLVGVEPGTKHGEYRRICVPQKKNAGLSKPGLLFTTEWVAEAREVRVNWGAASELTADEVYSARDALGTKPKRASKADVDACASAILEVLQDARAVVPDAELDAVLAKSGFEQNVARAARGQLIKDKAVKSNPVPGGKWGLRMPDVPAPRAADLRATSTTTDDEAPF